jgi:3-deoxy-7-phosphoheptulonate synthase
MAKAAVAAGADGLMVEVHPDPQRALSDGDQSLTPAGFRQLMEAVRKIARAVGRKAPGEDASPFEKARRNSAARRGVGWGAAG